jgi:hypothetical protein
MIDFVRLLSHWFDVLGAADGATRPLGYLPLKIDENYAYISIKQIYKILLKKDYRYSEEDSNFDVSEQLMIF